MFTKKCWLSLCPTLKSKANANLSGGCLTATLNNCDRWLCGSSSRRAKKKSWNKRRHIGNQFGEHWYGLGSQYERSEKAQGGSPARCIWRRRYPIADDGDARR